MLRLLPRNLTNLLLLTAVLMAPAGRLAAQKTAAAATYVGSAACSRCHLEIARSFAKASMGHSLTAITPEVVKALPLPASYYDAGLDRHYEVRAGDGAGQLLESEFAVDAKGAETFRATYRMEWIVGTGENGFGALLRRGGYLFQAPLSYYTRAGAWSLSPGYEHGDLGFNREIQPGCIYCHSGRPQPVAGLPGKYEATAFTQTSVGCENCHGPGSAHVAAMREGDESGPVAGKAAKADPTIVNPGRLTGRLADDICMSCHQVGDARVLQPGKSYQDFRPGEPLARTLAVFQVRPTLENPPQDDHLEHFYSMSLSKCYRATRNGAAPLTCIRCHDPHVEPTEVEAPAYFNGKCMSCHTRASCTGPAAARAAVGDNCIGCHMPKRDIRVISHSTATNHRIVRSPDEAFPEEAFEPGSGDMPGVQLLDASDVPGSVTAVVRLQAYGILKASRPEFEAAWRTTLGELETTGPDNALVQAAAGHRDLDAKRLAEAVGHLRRAVALDPQQMNAWLDLSEALDQDGALGQAGEAVECARRAIALDPFGKDPQKALVARLIAAQRYDEAVAAMERYLELFPEDDFMRRMLAIAKAP